MEHAESGRIAKRVVVVVSRKSRYWATAWASSEGLIAVAFRLLQVERLIPSDAQNNPSTVTFIAKERWDLRTYLVFDIFHDTYNADEAHIPGRNDLPVISVFLGEKKESAGIAGRPTANKVNTDIRALHNSTGPGSRPPFTVDHIDGQVPFYPNPRTSYATSTS
ncbi:hypothetical protein SPBR_09011 [Sporothrix brasiliensis 5110]|uniref:Uncharacterized protein n=1 Tax=Sporothrix brasiliensis 5110 TaxID=1398154 RepID=A0A0C2IHX9_9PEZI|nr:uncharacterized protein SPBR_09011 [Sporothrix brasiliensis 5110]KIH88781.1 hypothetical protein SPBR_09011 [Sporothrix brasiliensis 5110]